MIEFLAGALGGICGVVVGYPFDTLKTLCQSAKHQQRLWDLTKNIHTMNNGRGFFAGLSVPVASYIAIGTTTFGTFNYMSSRLETYSESASDLKISWITLLSSATAGLVQLIPSTPIENVKIRMQCTATQAKTETIPNVVSAIMKQEGIKGFYRGVLAHALRDIPGFITYFCVFEYASKLIVDKHLISDNQLVTSGLAGSLGGVASWIVTYPFDIMKTRLQANKDKNMFHTIKFMRQAGWSILYRGITITLLRSVIVDGTMFAMNDKATHILRRMLY